MNFTTPKLYASPEILDCTCGLCAKPVDTYELYPKPNHKIECECGKSTKLFYRLEAAVDEWNIMITNEHRKNKNMNRPETRDDISKFAYKLNDSEKITRDLVKEAQRQGFYISKFVETDNKWLLYGTIDNGIDKFYWHLVSSVKKSDFKEDYGKQLLVSSITNQFDMEKVFYTTQSGEQGYVHKFIPRLQWTSFTGMWKMFYHMPTQRNGYECSKCGFDSKVALDICPKCEVMMLNPY